MGLCYKTSRWADRLWQEHLETSECGRKLVAEGIHRQGNAFAGFPADLHARLYLPTEPTVLNDAPEWATRLHRMTLELGEWHQLKLMTARNGFAAGVAAEVMLNTLLPHVPDRPEVGPEGGEGGGEGSDDDDRSNQDPQNHGQEQQLSDTELRAALRKAARSARDAVAEAEEALEGLGPGSGMNRDRGRMDLRAVREAHARLKDSPRLKEVAKLAGRFERIAAAKARTRVNPGVGEIHGVGPGDEIDRLLPSELVFLKKPAWKRVLMARLMERRALTYAMRGMEPMGRGPVVILLDESGSMRECARDVWSKAVALAVLNTTMKENRAVHIVGFTGKIEREVTFEPGKWTVQDVQAALDVRCNGGTDFDRPIHRACELIRTSRMMRQADVLMITDGEQGVSVEVEMEAQSLTRTEGVSWFVVGIGGDAVRAVSTTLGGIATSVHLVTRCDEGVDADIVTLHRKAV